MAAPANPGSSSFDSAASERLREKAERLRENEERLRLAMDAASMGAWDWDFSTGEVHWTGDQEKLFGLTPGTFDGTFEAFGARVHPQDYAAMQARMAAAVAKKRTRHRDEFRIVRADGSVRWMVTNGRIYYDEQGRATRMIGINLDVTESKHAEEAIRESEKLAATGRLAATIAHEINNPLASMTNLLFLIEQHPSLDEAVRAYAVMAAQELQRMSHIVKQTLAFHRQSDVPTPISITDLVENVLTFHERGVTAGSVRFTRRFEGEQECEGYAGELRQVISNLLLNAVQAVEGQGKVAVHIYPSRLWSSDDAPRGTRIVIADNGSGIRPQDRAHIFEPFFTTKPGKGTGLGLWVAAGIIRKHNGAIRIATAGRGSHAGTTVSLFLPSPKAAADASVEALRRELLATRRSVQMRLRFSNR
jgi:PAS domain S-box-containing protein